MTLTCWVQGPEWWSAIISALCVALCGYELRVPGTEVVCGQHVGHQQWGAAQQAPEHTLHGFCLHRVLWWSVPGPALCVWGSGSDRLHIWGASPANTSNRLPNPNIGHDPQDTVNDGMEDGIENDTHMSQSVYRVFTDTSPQPFFQCQAFGPERSTVRWINAQCCKV